MKKLKLTDIAPYSGKRVQPFDGVKRYMSTGDLKEDNLSFEDVTYQSKPSRADITVREGDILFAKMTNTNKALQIDKAHDGIIVSTGFSVHRPIENVLNGDYFLQFLKHEEFHKQKNKLCTGAIQSAISNTGIEKILVPVPEYNEQLHIANLLSKAENLIIQRKESIHLLDEFLKSTFLDMFGDPVMNDKNWNTSPFNKVGIFYSGGTPSKSRAEFWEGDFPWVSPKDMKTAYIKDSQDHISQLVFTETTLKQIKPYSLLIVVRGMILAHSFPTAINTVKVSINQDMKAIEPNEKFNVFYLRMCIDALKRQILDQISSASHGTKKFDSSVMNKLQIPVPPVKLQIQFAQIVEKTEALKIQYQQSLQELENLYGSLSQKAFKGELFLVDEKNIQQDVKSPKLIKPLIKKKAKVIELKPTNVDYYKRTLLSAEIVWQLHKESTFGHLKLQKLIYLCQKSTDMQLPTNFLRQAMGPYDNRLMRSIDKQLKEKEWFEYHKDQILKYRPLKNAGQHRNDFIKHFSNERESIQFLIDKFKSIKSGIVEIVATLYACMDNMLYENVLFSESLLIQRFYEWSEEKEQFKEQEVRRVFSRMKETGIIPKEYSFQSKIR